MFSQFLMYFVSCSLCSVILCQEPLLSSLDRAHFCPFLPALTSAGNLDTHLAEKKLCYILKSQLFNLQAFSLIKHPELGESSGCIRFHVLLVQFKLNASSRPKVKG